MQRTVYGQWLDAQRVADRKKELMDAFLKAKASVNPYALAQRRLEAQTRLSTVLPAKYTGKRVCMLCNECYEKGDRANHLKTKRHQDYEKWDGDFDEIDFN